jgi:hypothetical protein
LAQELVQKSSPAGRLPANKGKIFWRKHDARKISRYLVGFDGRPVHLGTISPGSVELQFGKDSPLTML